MGGGSCWEESRGAAKCCFFTQKVINSDFNINHSLARLRKRHSAPFSPSPGCCSYDLSGTLAGHMIVSYREPEFQLELR